MTIELRTPGSSVLRLEDERARALVGVLWDVGGRGSATAATEITLELKRPEERRQRIDLDARRATLLAEALSRLASA